jgi:hypothetical protein
MISHPDTLLFVSDVRRNDLVRTAERERLADLASGTRSSRSCGATWAIITSAGAKLTSIAARVIALGHPAFPAPQLERS